MATAELSLQAEFDEALQPVDGDRGCDDRVCTRRGVDTAAGRRMRVAWYGGSD